MLGWQMFSVALHRVSLFTSPQTISMHLYSLIEPYVFELKLCKTQHQQSEGPDSEAEILQDKTGMACRQRHGPTASPRLLRRCQARLQSLAAMGAPQRGATVPWNRARLDRLLADHLLRRGHLATAALLAHDTGIQVPPPPPPQHGPCSLPHERGLVDAFTSRASQDGTVIAAVGPWREDRGGRHVWCSSCGGQSSASQSVFSGIHC